MTSDIEHITGGNEDSLQLDLDKGLDDYVHLCLTPHHPMEYLSKKRGSIIESRFLKIDLTALDVEDVKACTMVSTKEGAEIIDIKDFWQQIDWEAWTKYWNDSSIIGTEEDDDLEICKVEILVPKHIANKFICNLD